MLKLLLAALISSSMSVFAYDFPTEPDPKLTTGDLCDPSNPDFGGYRYAEKIAYCNRNVDSNMKKKVYEAYGVPEKCRKRYTVDHFLPLSMGGSNEFENLWPEHKNVKATRQDLEQEMFNQMRTGQIKQEQALKVIVEAKLNPGPAVPEPCE